MKNLFVNVEPVVLVVEAFDAEPSSTTDRQFFALKALENAMVVMLVDPNKPVPVTRQNGVPLGDETMPVQLRLEARLEAACRIIDSFQTFSVFSVKFVMEQNRFLQELRESRKP